MNERVTSVALQRGLFALRYVRSTTSGAVPVVIVQAGRGSESGISVISAPDDQPGVIVAPGGSLVVRAEQPGTLQVTIRSVESGKVPDAELQLEPLHAGRAGLSSFASDARRADAPQRAANEVMSRPSMVVARPRLELIGHVSRRGDVRVSEGDWIAGPNAPAPIEGIALRIVDQTSVTLEYQVLIGGPGAGWSSWIAEGFAGTQGKFRALHGIRFRLAGAEASRFQIEAEALFLGSATAFRKGREIELSSNAGADPLVGLKVALITDHAQSALIDQRSTEAADLNRNSHPSRVRVFRASSGRA